MSTDAPRPMPGDVPLPGFYDCLTVQFNATLYPKTAVWRWVAILRDPIGSTEIVREFRHQQPIAETTLMAEALHSVLRRTLYVGGFDAASREPLEPFGQ